MACLNAYVSAGRDALISACEDVARVPGAALSLGFGDPPVVTLDRQRDSARQMPRQTCWAIVLSMCGTR